MKVDKNEMLFQLGSSVVSVWVFQGLDAMVKTYKNVNISVEYQRFCTKPSGEGLFFQTGRNGSKEWYPTIKTYNNINISAEYQLFYTKP